MFTQGVAMMCTKEQYNQDLKQPLLEMGYKEVCLSYFKDCPYLVNNLEGVLGNLSNVIERAKLEYNRYCIDGYNPKLFLALAAMTDEEYGIKGEWWKCNQSYTAAFTIIKLYQASNKIDCLPAFIDDNNIPNGLYLDDLSCFRKATKEELINYFTTKQETKMKKIDNVVIENLSPEMGREILSYFREMGYDTDGFLGDYTKKKNEYYFYGVINGAFENYSKRQIEEANAQIIQLPTKEAKLKDKENMETPNVNYSATVSQMMEIEAIACNTWKPKIRKIIKDYLNESTGLVILEEPIVKIMFEAATSEQELVLQSIFPLYGKQEDKNAFIKDFSRYDITSTSEKLFNGDSVLQILIGATPDDKPELRGRAFYVNGDYKVEIGECRLGGTYISIYKE